MLSERLLGDLEVVEAQFLGIESSVELGKVGEHRRLIAWRIGRLDVWRIRSVDLLGKLGCGALGRAFSRCCFWNLAWLTVPARPAQLQDS